MLYLVICSLSGQSPDQKKIQEMDMEKLYKMSQMHSLSALVCMTLEAAGVTLSMEWQQAKEKAVRKSILLDAEYKKIASFFEQNKIWYMPLKGRLLQTLYPKKGMRQMADTDILFDPTYRKIVCDYMLEQGYEIEGYDTGNHDSYLKPPVYNFEMHVALVSDAVSDEIIEYYSNVKERLLRKSNDSYEYQFKEEDFYIFLIVHEYKHYSNSGTGLRSLADVYVYLNAKKDTLDFKYVEDELQKIGIGEYEKRTRKLCEKIFSERGLELLSEGEIKEVEYYLFSGTYGTQKQRIANQVTRLQNGGGRKRAKAVYLWKRVFPRRDILEAYCPAAKKSVLLLPYAWIKRCFIVGTERKQSVKKEIQAWKSVE